MIFYKRITICNLFAYNGAQSVEFTKYDGKSIYLLFGKNGFGKTSFIRSIKLLFAGSGLLNIAEKVPEVVLNFADNRSRGVFTPRTLLLGQNSNSGWQGVFNRRAVKNDENKFYVEIAVDDNGREILIKREWTRYPNLSEKLTFVLNDEILENNQAHEEIEQILPLNFLQFFVFDGEEIESMADEISTELKGKIQSMLNISVLDRIIEQIGKAERKLVDQSNAASQTKSRLSQLEGEFSSVLELLDNAKFNIKIYENEVAEKNENLRIKKLERDSRIKNNSKESESLQNAKNTAISEFELVKKRIEELAGEILFLGLDETFSEVFKELEKSADTSGFNENDLTKLAKFSAEYLFRKVKFNCDQTDLSIALRDAFLEFIRNSNDLFKGINKSALLAVYGAAKENSVKLLSSIKDAKNVRIKIAEASRELDYFISNTSLEDELKTIDKEIENLENKKLEANDNLRINLQKKSELEQRIVDLENSISNLKDQVGRDRRIKNQLEILNEVKKQTNFYKQGRIARTSLRLKDEILSNYKCLLPNDNVVNIEIENFIVKLVGKDGEAIAVRSQSAGQKQIAAISIFWALSKLSQRRLPLIIDTPLARLDADNRKNIIQNYYANASNQVIVLPTDTEFSEREMSFADDKIAGIYEIINGDDARDHARIVRKA